MSALIAIDWGTTSFRAYLMDRDGSVKDKVSSPDGIMQVGDREFETILFNKIGGWLTPGLNLPIIASGMITSRQGWIETPYLPCPANLTDLGGNLKKHTISKGQAIYFVPGVCQEKPIPNIMRGEETQMAGLNTDQSTMAILPGTHSKWIQMEQGTITGFSTFMTGEIFAAITEHTILGRLMTDNKDPEAFSMGVHVGFSSRENTGGILSKLFSARAMPLMGMMYPESIGDYISGLLLGTEIKEAIQEGVKLENDPIICGNNRLANRYRKALSYCSIQTKIGEPDLAASGLYRIAKSANLI